MPQLDGLIQDLAIQKQLFFVFVGVAVATIGWAVTHRDQPGFLLITAIFVTLVNAVFAWTRLQRMYQLIGEIKHA